MSGNNNNSLENAGELNFDQEQQESEEVVLNDDSQDEIEEKFDEIVGTIDSLEQALMIFPFFETYKKYCELYTHHSKFIEISIVLTHSIYNFCIKYIYAYLNEQKVKLK